MVPSSRRLSREIRKHPGPRAGSRGPRSADGCNEPFRQSLEGFSQTPCRDSPDIRRPSNARLSHLLGSRVPGIKEKHFLPQLDPRQQSPLSPSLSPASPRSAQHGDASTCGSGWTGPSSQQSRGRSLEPQAAATASAPANMSSQSLMGRRTFSLPDSEAGRSTPRLAPLPQPCRQSTSAAAWRPPKPQSGSCNSTSTAKNASQGEDLALPLDDVAGGSEPGQLTPRLRTVSGLTRGRLTPSPRQLAAMAEAAEAAYAEARPSSESPESYELSKFRRMSGSILRTVSERSDSQTKKVSFSGDCKRAPPSSIADLISRSIFPSDAEDLQAIPAATARAPISRRNSSDSGASLRCSSLASYSDSGFFGSNRLVR
mmetsp:Transcript_16502/g.26381  ORF Transcript_16502/g.26381 Transcript_16502/m.26381 type:complete len:371 (+) Transcript_16502:124-1236(+)